MQKKVEFKQFRDFGQTVNDTVLFVKQQFKPLVTAFFLYCGFFVVAGMLAVIVVKLRTGNVVMSEYSRTGNLFNFSSVRQLTSAESLLETFFMVLAYCTMQVVVVSFIKLYVDKGNVAPTRDELWGYIRYYYFRVVIGGFLMFLFLCLGYVLCLIPGIWLFPIVSLFFPAMIIENGSFEYSFTRMFTVIKGNWWMFAGTLLVVWLIVTATAYLINLPMVIITFVNAFSGITEGNMVISILTTAITHLSIIFMMLPAVCSTLAYYGFSEKKEATGLLERISRFGEQHRPRHLTDEEY